MTNSLADGFQCADHSHGEALTVSPNRQIDAGKSAQLSTNGQWQKEFCNIFSVWEYRKHCGLKT
ncbi:hypothetical protein [Pseudomonas lactucae]|uniref:Uncharacterized protein n=1 Tax=Pseudomonas lactucae TaxID=2813360 RepID=A0A9X0YFA0_9PSED|nr:hypothetical protein [Pseudomonas lactucae]MBN2978777.1 hypothetical protein [Pseudomonas lactucae]MBN2987766.1 hypothetical protein [Pseudomonas lactucae]